jgi:DNA polymerase IV
METRATRKIIHVDMDAFYAAVETLDNPSYRSVPLIVGGPPDSRAVVCTSNYLARQYGIKSAMACSVAKRLCPHAVFVRPRFERYQEISKKIRAIFREYTDKVEPLSLDEAYLDVTGHPLYATQIAKEIRHKIKSQLGLTCSAGAAPNKLVAKIASDWRKPDGLTVITPDQVTAFMEPLPVRKIHGVGPATERRLNAIGITTCSDLRTRDLGELKIHLGSSARWLQRASWGQDDREVESTWVRKSYGREVTLSKDILGRDAVIQNLTSVLQDLNDDMKRLSLNPRTVTLKLKYFDFESITRRKTTPRPLHRMEDVWKVLLELLSDQSLTESKRIRLVGCSLSQFES